MRFRLNQRLGYSRRWFFFAFLTTGVLSVNAAIPPSIDLSIEKVQFSPERMTERTSIEIAVTIQNRGSNPAYDVRVEIVLENKKQVLKYFKEVPLLSVVPQNGTAVSIPISFGTLPQGVYTTKVRVDPTDLIPETNELNNTYSRNFEVYK